MECEHRTVHAWIDIDYTEVVQPELPNVMVPMGMLLYTSTCGAAVGR